MARISPCYLGFDRYLCVLRTQPQPYTFDGVILEASPGTLSILASTSSIVAATSTIELWEEKPAALDPNRRSSNHVTAQTFRQVSFDR